MYLNVLSLKQKECFWVLAKTLAKADGSISIEEEHYLKHYLKEMEFDLSSAQSSDISTEVAIEYLSESPYDIKMKIYIELIALALCNKDYDEKEKELMQIIQKKFSIANDTKEIIINLIADIFDTYQKLEVIINE